MSEEIKKEAQDVELNPEELDQVAGGLIGQGEGGGFEIVDDSGNGNAIGIYNTLEEATFAASGICPRCGKTFSGKQAIDNHIKEWASGQK